MPTTKSSAKTASKTTSKTAAKPEAKAPAGKARESKTEAKAAEPKSAAKVPVAAPVKSEKLEKPAKVEAKKTDAESPPRRPESKDEPMTLPRISAAEPAEERVSVTSTMSKEQLEHFRRLLEEKRDDIVKKAKETLEDEMVLDANDLPDEMDLASSEYLQSFTFRLRGREKSFLDKINKALERIDGGSFGICEECGDEISVKRLEARPETTLCIRCKEDQERAEKDYG
jgi:DnaK suppressor protein